ncbi:hypothetical protein ACWEU6_17895 [Streptosporangium sandarakinum]|uniref:hypothetical protein n=1 Tax=Streptosporangium sandarakinum TaxID=1260955 RepID=UPI00368196F1
MSGRRDWMVIGCVLLVALATVTASFTAQAGLGELAGWTTALHVFGLKVSMAWLLPVTVDAYGIAATRIATNKARYSAEVRGHAFGHALAAVVVSVLGNAMFHLIEAKVIVLGGAAWVLVVAVSVVPPIALGGLAHLLGVAARTEVETAAPASTFVEQESPGETVVEQVPAAPVTRAEGVTADTLRQIEADKTVAGRVPVEVAEPGTAGPAGGEVEPPAVPAVPAPSPAPTPVLTPAPDVLFPVAAAKYAAQLAEGKVPSITRIKADLKIGQPRAARIRAYLDQLAEAKPTSTIRGQDAEGFSKENPPTEADFDEDGLTETQRFIVRRAWDMPDPEPSAEDSEQTDRALKNAILSTALNGQHVTPAPAEDAESAEFDAYAYFAEGPHGPARVVNGNSPATS